MQAHSPARYHQALVEISLFNGYLCLAKGNMKKAAEYAEEAEQRWKKHQTKFTCNKVFLLPPLEDLKAAAFVKTLKHFPHAQKKKLLKLAHHSIAGKLQIPSNLSFDSY